MADFTQSFGFELQVYEVDPVTWADKRLVGGFTSASVSRTKGDMIESGTLTADMSLGEEFDEGYYRLAMKIEQEGVERYDLCTLYCMSVSGNVDYGVDVVDINGVSVLYPARDKVMDMGSYAAKGADGADYVRRLLTKCLHAPVTATGSFYLSDDFVFDIGARTLESVWSILDSAGWCMQIDGRGRVTIMPIPNQPSLRIDDGMAMSGVQYERAVADVPNRYMAFDGTTLGQFVNESIESPVSTVNRGFVKDFDGGVDTSPTLVAGESVEAYCRRKLIELSTLTEKMTKTTEYHDGIYPYSMVTVRMEPSGETRNVMVDSQEITCTDDLTISETYTREVSLWR